MKEEPFDYKAIAIIDNAQSMGSSVFSVNSFMYLFVDIFFNSIVIGDIDLVEVDGVVDVGPHVVVLLHMLLKTLQYNYQKGILMSHSHQSTIIGQYTDM